MESIIFRITTQNDALASFFTKYEPFLNSFFNKLNQPAVIEVIQNGFIYIVQDFLSFQVAAKNFPKLIDKPLGVNDEMHTYLTKEIKRVFQLSGENPIIFFIQNEKIKSDQIMPLFSLGFQPIAQEINFDIVDNNTFSITFYQFEAIVKYFELLYNLI
jgi:hypothetical protein